jgi:hypothetical protein
MIISVPVQVALWACLVGPGAELVAVHELADGSYAAPMLPWLQSLPQTIIFEPVHTMVPDPDTEGALVPVDVGVQLSVKGS